MTDTLLAAADEIRLARTIEAGLLAADLLARADFSLAGADELLQLEGQGQHAWQQFLLANVRLVQAIAAQAATRSGASLDELFQEGFLGLADAVQRWDFTAGYRFSTYATQWVRRRVVNAAVATVMAGPESARTAQRARGVRSLADDLTGQLQRVVSDAEMAELLGRSPGWVARMRHLQPCSPLEPDLIAIEVEPEEVDQGTQVLTLLPSLPFPEREVLRRRFGLDGGEPLHQRATAEALGLSLSTVRRYEARALRRLRGWLSSDLAA
ncbi:MAG: sigma-70 family RNA polymerase sigma factor [Micropruina sp.]|nr:sigma-70 family RNA polymerase sigma factor [Micropruina sp.]